MNILRTIQGIAHLICYWLTKNRSIRNKLSGRSCAPGVPGVRGQKRTGQEEGPGGSARGLLEEEKRGKKEEQIDIVLYEYEDTGELCPECGKIMNNLRTIQERVHA